MNAGEIGTEAGRIFAYNLPSAWIYRSQEDQNDFGIDGEIELKDSNGKALGKESIFKVQIKGEEFSTYINNNQILSFTLTTERLKYYHNFKIPVILVVVEVSTQKIFWKALTIDEELKSKVLNATDQSYIQVHLPTKNTLSRGSPSLADSLLKSVNLCWDHLSILGIKASIAQYPSMTSTELDHKIHVIGDALYKAYHQQLDNLFHAKDYSSLYDKAETLSASPVVPSEDRFLATLYYWQAFQIAPNTRNQQDYFDSLFRICHNLIYLARLDRSKPLRLIALGKARRTQFKISMDALFFAHHATNHFNDSSLEHLIFDGQTQQAYRACCFALQKLVDLCNRLFNSSQYHILADLFIEISPSILVFRQIHQARGTTESIEFIEHWHQSLSSLVLHYCVFTNNTYYIQCIYRLIASDPKNSQTKPEAKAFIIKNLPELSPTLERIEEECKKFLNPTSFLDASIDEQKKFFIDMAKNLGMDPDDPNNELGDVVSLALANYDPSEIMKSCEHLFVDYRPGGIVAQSLQMHSAGGMTLLICMKHKYAMATGGSIKDLYLGIHSSPAHSFENQHCKNCNDCSPRPNDWKWSFKWHYEIRNLNMDIINTYQF
ncbi:DUF4365 domain-containing protein [Pseudomonas sp. NBRC 111123]|uniref:DUF4365 domain-containing protein n=1 Tax=Pseudomonas sp. NBRC 111123 TaxID=1661038 RepID=UPI000760D6D2|nr:DUF4365 domain-containing protein [Pseudomonas sp. NBRC 111123]